MQKRIKDIFKLAFPMGAEKRKATELAARFLSPEDVKTLTYFLKIDRCFASIQKFNTSSALFADAEWPIFKSHLDGKELHEFLERINAQIQDGAQHAAFNAFAPEALPRIASLIAANIVGMQEEKQSAALLLFAKDPVHLLLIGDPGTGKTDILRSLYKLAPIGSFGLGSGVSGVGLSAIVKGEDLLKGLLPLADGGVACIDELNLIKAKDLAALYNAMEKGFVSYDKGSTHEQLAARVRILATANPTQGTFIGRSAEVLRKQVPFGDPLLTRFHLLFIVRKPSAQEFEEITKKIVKGDTHTITEGDAAFVKAYVTYATTQEVTLDSQLEMEIVAFVRRLKEDERKFLIEIGPRTVVGIVRLVKAVARAELAQRATKKHLEHAFALVRKSLYLRAEEDV